ncbi:MAG: MFS transporter [Negativicutes bacterium]|nr:MFS transporter [Negativicutes bacterium]
MNTNSGNAKMTNVRYLILAMLFIVTTVNYADRSTLAMTAPAIRKDLGLDPVSMGYIFSAFGWSYAAMQIPSGWLLDKYGSRLVYGVGLFFWSLFTALQGTVGFLTGASVFIVFFLYRLLMGGFEAPSFPADARLAATWFPTNQRGLATSVFNSSQYFALAAFNPLMGWLATVYGWQTVFYAMGCVGLVLSIYWFKVIRDPKDHPKVNQAEIDYIQAGGGLVDIGAKTEIKWDFVRQMLTSRMMIGIYIGQFCINSISWFFLTWFPTYLVQAKGMSILKVGIVASLPAICGFIGNLLSGAVSDWMLRRGISLTVARKTPIVLGLIMSGSIIIANYTSLEWVVIAVMSLAFFSKGVGALGWVVVGDTSPKEMVGLSGGIFNLASNIASIATPIVIGYILQATHSFNGALIYVGAMGICGAASYLFIVPSIQRFELKK